MNNGSTALATVAPGPLEMVGPPGEALARLKVLEAFVREVMVKDVDYGEVPGTGGRRSLLQPGAQKLCEVYGLTSRFEIEKTEQWEAKPHPFFHYSVRCVLERGGRFVGEGHGSCNSRESHYAYRWAWPNEVPPDIDKARLRRKEFTGKGNKKYVKYRVENEDVCDLVNTLLKMGVKRALVGATIAVTRSSGLFTQDVEDGVVPVDHDDGLPDGDEEIVWTAEALLTAMGKAETPAALQQLAKIANDFKDRRDDLMAGYKAALKRLDEAAAAAKAGKRAP